MNALKLLKQDHRTVEALFKRFEKAGDNAVREKKNIARQIVRELSIHASIEEQLLYPAARATDERLTDLVLESLEEHHVAKATLAEIEKMSADDERFEAKLTVLMENIRHHVKEEEGELFPRIQKVMGNDELNAIGAALEQAKKAAPTPPHPMAPDTPPGNVIVGALAKILDSGKDLIGGMARRRPVAAKRARGKKSSSRARK